MACGDVTIATSTTICQPVIVCNIINCHISGHVIIHVSSQLIVLVIHE
jgi:hypothetical protein